MADTGARLGVDIDCLQGHGMGWPLVSGPKNVANAIGRRLITPRGGLFYDPDYGFDVREYLGVALARGKLAELIAGVEAEAMQDVRVQAVVASATATGSPSTALKISLSVTLADAASFDMILSIQDLVPGAPTVTLDFDTGGISSSGLSAAQLIAAPFTPMALGSTLKLWLRGDLGVTLSGSNVTAWADQSGNANSVVNVGTTPFVTSSINGMPGVTFGTNYLRNTTQSPLSPGSPRTAFVVAKASSAAGGIVFWNRISGGGPSGCVALPGTNALGGTGLCYTDFSDGARNANIPVPTINGVPIILQVGHAGTGTFVTCKLSGVAQTVTQGTAVQSDSGTVGFSIGDQSGSFAPSSDICEVIVCDSVLSAANELLVKTYLSSRYGIAVA